jgi:hypothetical protein
MLKSETMLVHGARIEKPATIGTDRDSWMSVLYFGRKLADPTCSRAQVPQMELDNAWGDGAEKGVNSDRGVDGLWAAIRGSAANEIVKACQLFIRILFCYTMGFHITRRAVSLHLAAEQPS